MVTDSTKENKMFGKVKWFNNKAGYGFITMKEEESTSGTDIFVHHSSLTCDSDQYRYLVQGEYVEFVVDKLESGENSHENQAKHITGILANDLMCETRNFNREGVKRESKRV